jgi:hypothetical protein
LDFALLLARSGLCQKRLHLFSLEGGIAVMRGNTSGLEPGISPQAHAQRSELAEMRRPFDRPSLKSQLLRRRIVVNGGVRIIDLGMEHLVRPAPRAGERIGGFGDDRLECFGLHGFPAI